MGTSQKEQIVEEVSFMLKSLECAICLELLQTPVSTGCGHFFCKFCITETLQNNYRTPCPLCKKPFTRRGIQEATQRQTIIKAAKKLAEICEQITGKNLLPKGNTQKEITKEASPVVENQSLRKQEKKKSRKRKSEETEINNGADDIPMPILSQKGRLPNQGDENKCSLNVENHIESTNKRYCQTPNIESDDELYELPNLDGLFMPKNKETSKLNPVIHDKSLSKEMPDLPLEIEDITLFLEESKNPANEKKKNYKTKDIEELNSKEKNENKLVIRRSKNFSKSKNKNALKNKTNIVNGDKYVESTKEKEIETSGENVLDQNNEVTLKENIADEPQLIQSPVKKTKIRKLSTSVKRKSRCSKSDSNASVEEEKLIQKLTDAENFPLTIEVKLTDCMRSKKDNSGNECFNLSEIEIPSLQSEVAGENAKNDEIMGTEVSVQAVLSPQVNKHVLLNKSPGWSRVKKVGKDFRVKKFSKLSVEKNSSDPNPSDETSTNDGEDTNKHDSNKKSKNDELLDSADEEDFQQEQIVHDKNDLDKDSAMGSSGDQSDRDDELLIDQNQDNSMEIDIVNTNLKANDSKLTSVSDVTQQEKEKTGGNISDDSDCLSIQNIPKANGKKCSDTDSNDQSENASLNNKNVNDCVETPMECADNEDLSIQVNVISPTILSKNYDGDNVNYPHKQIDSVVRQDSSLISNLDVIPQTENPNNLNTDQLQSFDHREKDRPISGVVKESRISKISKISKCNVSPQTALQRDNVYYIEHSQQTSQRLDIYDTNNANFQLPSAFPSELSHYHTSLVPNGLSRYNDPFAGPYNFNRKRRSSEKTKVVKRTCLTLEEIQDFFTRSNLSGQTEMICSLPFLSGSYKLNLCVSEETLNVSVLKVESDIPVGVPQGINYPNMQVAENVLQIAEIGIQTSCSNSPVHSPTVIPSSNIASDASEFGECSDSATKPKYTPFPYLSNFFSDSESTPQLNSVLHPVTAEKEAISPILTKAVSSKSPIQIDETLQKTPGRTEEEIPHDLCNDDDFFSQNLNENEECQTKMSNEVLSKDPQVTSNINEVTNSSNDRRNTCDDDNVDMVDLSQDSVVEDVDCSILKNLSSSKQSKSGIIFATSGNKNSSSIERDQSCDFIKQTSPTGEALNESLNLRRGNVACDVSPSDPDMIFANELVAPLKSIADKINQDKTKSYTGETLEGKQTLPNPEEILNLIKDNTFSNKSSKQKNSRLSLKSKKSSKFKRIQSYDSDSDSSELPQNDVSTSKRLALKSKSDLSSVKVKSNDVPCTSFQEQSTLNSMLSDDTNPSEIVKEIEDIDQKMRFIQEKLKQCGHGNLLSVNNSVSLNEEDKMLQSDDESEDSDDLFSVPPTPQDE